MRLDSKKLYICSSINKNNNYIPPVALMTHLIFHITTSPKPRIVLCRGNLVNDSIAEWDLNVVDIWNQER